MLLYWFQLFVQRLRWLLRSPQARDLVRLDVNAKCPACGHKRGKLRCVHIKEINAAQAPKIVMVEHTCLVDGAKWYEKPVVADAGPERIHGEMLGG